MTQYNLLLDDVFNHSFENTLLFYHDKYDELSKEIEKCIEQKTPLKHVIFTYNITDSIEEIKKSMKYL